MRDFRKQLVHFGFDGTEDRLTVLVSELQKQDFYDVADLDCAGPFEAGREFSQLSIDEVAFLNNVCERLTAVSRSCRESGQKFEVLLPVALPERVMEAVSEDRPVLDVSEGGPKRALKRLRSTPMSMSDKAVWVEQARMSALVGSCPLSHKSVVSGLRCYVDFVHEMFDLRGREFPPTVEILLAWSTLFRHERTFANYVGYVRLACHMLGLSAEACDSDQVRRAKVAIAKKLQFHVRERKWIRLGMVRQLIEISSGFQNLYPTAMLFLLCYVFMLRLPSEALRIRVGSNGCLAGTPTSGVDVTSDKIIVKMGRRKNRALGSTLHRFCWCTECAQTCPIHVLGAFFTSLPVGTQPFADISAAAALSQLRVMLALAGVEDAGVYRTHDLKRGHARDMQANGATVGELLRAADWSGPVFTQYLDMDRLADDAVFEAHFMSDADEEL